MLFSALWQGFAKLYLICTPVFLVWQETWQIYKGRMLLSWLPIAVLQSQYVYNSMPLVVFKYHQELLTDKFVIFFLSMGQITLLNEFESYLGCIFTPFLVRQGPAQILRVQTYILPECLLQEITQVETFAVCVLMHVTCSLCRFYPVN